MSWGLKSISDYFIGDILRNEEDLLERSKIKTVFWFCFLILFFLIAYLPVLYSLAYFTVILAFVAVGILGLNIYFLKTGKSHTLILKFSLTVLLVFVLMTLQFMVPSNPSGYLMWAILLILISNFTLGKNWAIGFFSATILGLISVSLFAHYDIRPAILLGFNKGDISPLDILSPIKLGMPLFFIVLTLIEFINIGTKTNTELNQNLTLQKNLNSKITRSESKYRRLVEGVGDIVLELDPSGKFTYVNQAFTKVTGYSSDELIGKPFHMFLKTKEELDEHVKGIREQIRGRITMSYCQFKIYTKSGEPIWVGQNRSMFYDKAGKVTSCTCMARDITIQKKANDHLKSAKLAAEKASLAKAQFLSSMSHEIRTPLNAVIGTINLIDQENLCVRTKEHFETLKYSADTLLKLVSDILDLNKLEDCKLNLEKTNFSLKNTVAFLKGGLENLAAKKALDFVINYDKSLPETVYGDSLRLAQLLNNIVHNAIKFTQKGGIEITVMKHQQTEDSVKVYFAVEDTGVGISDENIESIFGAFIQDNDETIRNGSGLGLAISQKLVSLFESEIEVESELEKGSKFSFLIEFDLPNAAKKAEQSGVQIQPSKSTTSIHAHILVVEDNLINQKVTTAFLKKWDASFKVVANGQEAVDIVTEEHFDLILMDLQMPVMNGVEATKAIRAMGGDYSLLPIIALTASAVLEVRQNAMKAGLDDFITKPFKPENLNQVIKKHLDEREPHRVSES